MKTLLIIFITSIIFFGNSAMANEQDDIAYLLSFVAESDCIFIRNGKEHQASKASEHLAMKYDHVKKRIKTAEVFINKIASKSSISRKPYTVRCGEDTPPFPVQQWLTEALAAHRATTENNPK
jgi:hypothetical protein